ncbi:MAG: hypothetical protein FDZ70_05340 [Actinobacteria bacterium]|nr:MAG: hypothetical protein FDZ70_05340 [Actinomycetota bacterium]
MQPNEVVSLALALVLAPLCLRAASRARVRGREWFYAAFAVMLASYVFTIAEGFAAPDLLNFLEHLGYAASGLLFLRGIIAMRTSWGAAA